MSLLMKALEQAAKDRGETRNDPGASPAAATEPKPELSLALELLAPDSPAPQPRPDSAARPRPVTTDTGEATARDQSRAATVMRAGEHMGGGADKPRRVNPVIVFGALAGVFAVGFAIYVYLQIYHPAFLARRPPAQSSPPPVTKPPPPATPTAPGPVATTAPPAATAPTVTPPIPASSVLEAPAAERREPVAPPAASSPAKPAAPVPAPPSASLPTSRIAVSSGTPVATVNPQLVEAYNALQAGNIETAQRLYSQLARADPKNIDALLGLAASAALKGQVDDATRHYQQILQLDPRHALAQSGLIGLYGRSDPLMAETRLKQLIAREPSPFLYFTLGNLYADQSLWAQAQQAYFQAHHLEPGNPDYVYNLAVGLEHLSQPKLALDFYRQAAALAARRGHANFNAAQVQERINRLAAQVP